MKIPSIPQIYRHVNRWREIVSVLSKYGLADWLSRFDIDFIKGLLRTRDGEQLARLPRETRIRLALEELGLTFIKLGQILSTRPDVVGIALADELKQLQEHVPCDPPDVVRSTIEAELGRPTCECFLEFDEQPLASASIGQVHRARLKEGQQVVVKVKHHKADQRVLVDLDMIAALAQLAEHVPELANYRPRSLAAEFSRTLRRELDFMREERNLQHFNRLFAHDPTVRIPIPYPGLSSTGVLTMECLDGMKLSGPEALAEAGLDLELVARRGAELYLEMIFRWGVYHADPHPGNLLLMEGNVIGLLDFGMVGRLDELLREEMEQMLWAILERDPQYLTSIIMRLGSATDDVDQTSLSVDVAEFVEHYGNQPIDVFDLSGALREMIEVIRRYRIMLPAPLAMLLKVLIMLEGTARLLNPRFSLMEVMEPYRRKMMLRRLSPRRQLKKARRLYLEAEQLVQTLPRRLTDILHQIQSGKFDVHLDHRGLEPSVNRLVLGMLASALFLGSSIMIKAQIAPLIWGGVSLFGALGCLLSLALGLRLLRAINKSGHLDRRK